MIPDITKLFDMIERNEKAKAKKQLQKMNEE